MVYTLDQWSYTVTYQFRWRKVWPVPLCSLAN